MKIFISGAGGEVGNDLIKRLLEKNLKVVANIRDLKKIKYYDPNLKWIKHDFIKNLNKKMKIQIKSSRCKELGKWIVHRRSSSWT